MLPKSEDTVQKGHPPKSATAKTPQPPTPAPERPAAPLSKLSAARAAVQQFLSAELGAREIRVTKLTPIDHGAVGWSAEAEILVPNLEVKMLGLPLTQEVLEREHYTIELESDLSVRSFGYLGPDET